MEKFGIQLIALFIFTAGSYCAHSKTHCKGLSDSSGFLLIKKDKNIELYERWYEISTDQLAREVKVVYTINATLESAAALVENESKAILWNKSTNIFRILPTNENSWVSYIQYDLPWPIDNQDCVLQHTLSIQENNHVIIDFKSVDHEVFPTTKHISRISDIKGKWVFKRTPEGTRVEYSITTLPSPVLPRWVTDPLVRNNLIDSMDEFRNLLEGRKN